MNNLFGWVARRRGVVLASALLIAVIVQVVLRTTVNDRGSWFTLMAAVLPPLLLLACSTLAVRRGNPVTLLARAEVPAFDAPVRPAVVLGASAYTFFVVAVLAPSVSDIEADWDWFFATLVALIGGMLVAHWKFALGRFETRLNRDGIIFRETFGSHFVPWDALAKHHSVQAQGAHGVMLFLAHPELVRRRGLRAVRPAVSLAAGTDTELLAHAIQTYANYPDLRSAIGSFDELTRLQTTTPFAAKPPSATRP